MRSATDLSIGQRLTLGFVAVIMINAVLLGSLRHWHRVSDQAQSDFVLSAAPLRDAAVDLERSVLNVGIGVRTFLLDPSDANRRAHRLHVAVVRDRLAALQGIPRAGDDRTQIAEIAAVVNRYLDRANRQVEGSDLAESVGLLSINRVQALEPVHRFAALQESRAEEALATMGSSQDRVAQQVWLATVAAALTFVLIALIIARSVRRPVRDLVSVAGAMRAGDWAPALALRRESAAEPARDELAHLADAFAAAAAAIEDRERVLRAKGAELQAQNEEIQAQNEELQAQGEEIQAQNEELQAQSEEILSQNEELTQQADLLRVQATELLGADERKNEFIGLLAHELRNPMAALSNNLHILRHVKLDGQSPRVLDAMERQTRQLTRLMDDLLDVTRVSHGKVTLRSTPMNLVDVVNECIDDQRDIAAAAHVSVQASLPGQPVMIDGDRSRVVQVLCNLLDNSIKASSSGGVVHVHLAPDAAASVVRLHIRDTGVGIAREHLAAVFRPFMQAHGPTHTRSDGLGLGLALVKSFVELHGGTVSVQSDGAGRGAEFVVTFPLLQADAPREALPMGTAHPDDGAAPPRRIVIIEDNPDAAQSLREALELTGHSVRVASTAADGLVALRLEPPEILICDIGLPDMDGYAVARECANLPELASTMLVALSGYATPTDAARARAAGFHRHLAKPVAIDQLNALIAEHSPIGD